MEHIRDTKRSGRRATCIIVGYETIRDVLYVPDGLVVAGIYDDWDRMCIKIRLESVEGSRWDDLLPVVREGELIPCKYVEDVSKGYCLNVTFKWWFLVNLKSKWNLVKLWFLRLTSGE